MADTVTTTFYLDTTAEYNAWEYDAGQNATVAHDTSTTDADGASTNGQVQFNEIVKNRTAVGYMRKLMAWTDLGVPGGATVTHIQVKYSEMQYVNVLSSDSDSGPFEIRDTLDTTTLLTLISATHRTATSSYAQHDSGTVALPSSEDASTQHYFKLNHTLHTVNTSGAEVGILHDYIIITVTYETAVAPTYTPANGLIIWSQDNL